MKNKLDQMIMEAVVSGNYGDPFSVLGMHANQSDGKLLVRTFQPEAKNVWICEYDSEKEIGQLEKIHSAGLFEINLNTKDRFAYKLKLEYWAGHKQIVEDVYRFTPILGEMDIYLLAEGSHLELYEKMGAHQMVHENVSGVSFAVWAPNAKRVSVVGNFNNWDGRRHPMRNRIGCGVWELFIPGLCDGDMYKYEIKGANGDLLPLKADPFAFFTEKRPSTASVVFNINNYEWKDDKGN